MPSVVETAMATVLKRSNPSAQHQLFCIVIEEFPEVTAHILGRAGFRLPDYDEISAGPATYPMPDGSTVHGDTVVQFRRDGKPVFFAQAEFQRPVLQDRIAAVAAADLGKYGVPPGTVALMIELRDQGHDRMADQLARTILEECPDLTPLEDDMTYYAPAERLMTLPTFRDFINHEKAETEVSSLANTLVQYFTVKHDTPSANAIAEMRACTDPAVLRGWLGRAYNGETSAQIFRDTSK